MDSCPARCNSNWKCSLIMATIDEIQGAIAAVVEQDQDTAKITVGDYALRLNYINRRERKWAEVGKWRLLYKEYNTLTSTATGNLEVTMPEDFRIEAGFPIVDGTEQPVVMQTQKGQKSASDYYVTIGGNPQGNYTMKVYPGTNVALNSGVSIFVSYYSYPTSLASPADKISCPNPEYIITGVVGDIWESREDARFQLKKDEADVILKDMLEFEMTPTEASDNDHVKTVEETRYHFRWGRD